MGKNVENLTIEDVKTLEDDEKNRLVEYCKSIFSDEALKKKPAATKSVILSRENSLQYRLVVEQEKKRRTKSIEDSVRELGLSGEASKKLIKDFKAGKIKRYHLADIKVHSDLLEKLTPAQQKKAIDLIVANRKNFYQVNKEELSLFQLGGGQAGAYLIDLWYHGLLRTLEKMEKMLQVDREIFAEADPEQRKQLKKYFKRAGKKISEINPAL
ncbi:MAG TPA: hypothetical protein PKV91_07595 [Bacillota bacterium]|jgi:hypothetical protein|nr:hypothetical protein [Bacillota bacterium]HOA34775.1 hypothetical protein [Bacillota bacterium]HOJ84121.1 hypothetical protein [Bacillota bacterium]HOL15295.1 hypothetical protein [Bacillota bacterium]HPZ12205.1 hypothetical protein [Bacillota bacterium]